MMSDADSDADLTRSVVEHWRERWSRLSWQRRAGLDDEEPWSLPLVVRVEKAGPAPDHQHAMYAAALAVVRLLSNPSAAPEGPWHAPLARWMDGRIRKVVRRARGSRWADVGALPGVTAVVVDTEVRVLPPHALSQPPPIVRRLQVEGTVLPADADRALDVFPPAGPAGPVLSVIVAPRLVMSSGKACAQVGHAAQLALLELPSTVVFDWVAAGLPLRIRSATETQWRRILRREVEATVVQDAGFTEVEPGTHTCAATFADLDR